jgi:hypothetical protein
MSGNHEIVTPSNWEMKMGGHESVFLLLITQLIVVDITFTVPRRPYAPLKQRVV